MTENEKLEKYTRTGDLELLGQVYADYMHLVFGVCLKYFKNKDDAQDGVIQIFEKLVVDLKKHSVTNFKSWLYVTSKNFCLMELRKNNKIQNTSLENVEYALPVHHEQEEQIDEGGLEECIEKLPLNQRKCIRLFYLKEHCYKEITAMLDTSLNQVKSAIQNGKRNLKLCLERRGEHIQ